MNNQRENWIKNVLQSMKGSERAKPDPALFAKIQQQVSSPNATIISLYQWRNYAAACILLLFINTTVLVLFNQSKDSQPREVVASDSSYESLVISFQIYQ